MNYRLSTTGRLTLLALFFVWGMVGVLVRMTVPQFKQVFDLGYRDAFLVQSAFFLTYLVFARASGTITARIGFQRGVRLGLGLMGLGALGLALATLIEQFTALLPSVFLLASGITFLQVAANPLAAVEGRLRTAAGNLTFAQAFNSLGTVVAPVVAGLTFFGTPSASLEPVRNLFAVIGLLVLVLGLIAGWTLHESNPRVSPPVTVERTAPGPAELRLLIGGVMAIFLYVGAEVSITTTLINLLESEHSIAVDRATGAGLTALFWIGMMVGRFAAAPLLVRFDRSRVLFWAALLSALLCFIAASSAGVIGASAALSIGLFSGLQFPTIFAWASADLEPESRARAAGWLCTGILGGGVIPLFYGAVADSFTLQAALSVPAACFVGIAGFARYFGRTVSSAAAVPDRS